MTPLSRHIATQRRGFSLIELITALLAAMVLMSALAASVVISTNLLETSPSELQVARDRLIKDRLRSDLRYATGVNETAGDGFQIERPHPSSGISETINYQADQNGFTRQVASGPIATLDENSLTESWSVTGHTAPSETAATHVVRICGTSHASTLLSSSALDVPIPHGLKTGDRVLLCLSIVTPGATSPSSIAFSEPGWTSLNVLRNDNINLGVLHHIYDDTWPATVQISVSPASTMAVVMIGIENAHPTSPFPWTDSRSGYAVALTSGTHPTYSQTDNIVDRQLNLQVFAAQAEPWDEGRLGMPGFCDVIQATAGAGTASENSIGAVVRNGVAPSLSFTPRLLHQESGHWLGFATQVDVSP
ncbi:MAG: hypothetical protein P8L85_23790 [Rubripirellula sp.]|nr:hypothetical protein [Rubripirellula sp.]